MDLKLNSSEVLFSYRQSSSGACVVWKVEHFSTLKDEPDSYESPEFTFKDVKWTLQIDPFGYGEKNSGHVSLYLTPRSSFPSELKFELIIKNESGEDYSRGVHTNDFSRGVGNGFPKFFRRQDLLDGKHGNLLPNDSLTICCKMKIVEKLETEAKTFTDSENTSADSDLSCNRDSFLNKYRQPLDSGLFSDVVLCVGEETFSAHKVILSTHSEVFKAMFQSNLKESRDSAVDLIDIDVTAAKAMLVYIYTREVEKLSTVKTLELYVAADKYMLTELKEKCREYVSSNISTENVGQVYEVAKLHSDTELIKATKSFFACNVRSILKSKKWEEYSIQKSASSVGLLSYAITNDGFFF